MTTSFNNMENIFKLLNIFKRPMRIRNLLFKDRYNHTLQIFIIFYNNYIIV